MKTTTAVLRIAISFSVVLIGANFFPDKVFAQLINISTRGFVGTGDNVLIGGLSSAGPCRYKFLSERVDHQCRALRSRCAGL